MTTDITLRSVKGSPLTYAELDANFSNLQATADAAYDAVAGVGGKANAAAVGIGANDLNMGSFTGSTIPDGSTAKQALQALETTVEATSVTVATITASEAIAAGKFVNVYPSGGASRVRLAIASDPTKFANGFCISGIANGASGIVSFFGLNSAVSVPTPYSEVWLSDSSAGDYTVTAPTASGSIIQSLGPAVFGIGIFFNPQGRVLL